MKQNLISLYDPDFTITKEDFRQGGICIENGLKKFAIDHNFDLRDFLQNGISANKILQTGDGQAIIFVRNVYERRKRK